MREWERPLPPTGMQIRASRSYLGGLGVRLAVCTLISGCIVHRSGAGLPPDARRLTEAYEMELRRHARFPTEKSWYDCDEKIGRFCLQYGLGKGVTSSFHPGPPYAVDQRSRAVPVFRQLALQRPHDTLVSGTLVRYLIEGGQTAAAREAALNFAVADTSDAWSYLLLGLALDADAQPLASERAFGSALERLVGKEAEELLDPHYLLSSAERERYQELSPSERGGYHSQLWRAADPLYLTEGNEARAEHLSRYVYGRLLSMAPGFGGGQQRPTVGSNISRGVPPWRADVQELTRRFGVPVGALDPECKPVLNPTEREVWSLGADWNLTGFYCAGDVEHRGYYDPDNLTYVPPDFGEEKLPPPAEPGSEEWFYGNVAKRNGFHPKTLRAMRPLEHQLWRVPEGDSTLLRADVEFRLDDIAPAGAPVELGLFILDQSLVVLAEARDTVSAFGKLVDGWVQASLPEGAWAYSVEARELLTGQAARARHPLPSPPEGNLLVSDLVLLVPRTGGPVRGEDRFQPLGTLLLEPDQPVSLYAEIHGLAAGADGQAHYRVELRAAEGRTGGARSAAVMWTEEEAAAEVVPFLVDLAAPPVEPGLHRLEVTVTDEISGRSTRLFRIMKVRS